MGGALKPFLELLGEPVLLHALRPFLADPRVRSVVVAFGPDEVADPPGWLQSLDERVRIVRGGRTRAHSVRNALEATRMDTDVLVVHDAARPLASSAVVSACIEIAAGGEGAVAGCPAVDTIKEVNAERRVVSTPDRSRLWQAQTPQAFPAEVLRRAYRANLQDATDDASLVERLGLPVRMVDAGPGNLKITRPGDVALAEAILVGLGEAPA
jgi:2-C-methyl-D-erythritol 4-phosphate cytidylyltransferase